MQVAFQKFLRNFRAAVCLTVLLWGPSLVFGQPLTRQKSLAGRRDQVSDAAKVKEASFIDEISEPELLFHLDPSQSKVVRTKMAIERIAVTDPSVAEISEYSPTEFEVIGLKSGETTMTIWFQAEPDNPRSLRTAGVSRPRPSNDSSATSGNPRTLRYLVKVASDQTDQIRDEAEYTKIQVRINELFPNSQVQLFPLLDKLIIRGQARDSKEAAEIVALLGGRGGQSQQSGGMAADPGFQVGRNSGAPESRLPMIVNLLHVPGEQQVVLKVRVAELTRSAARELSGDFKIIKDYAKITGLGGGGNISAILDGGDVELFLKAFSSNGYSKILAEPTLVTLSGKPATFIVGGEFAVPTLAGAQGGGAIAVATTTFRSFGTQLSFTPTVMDKDKIRLIVAPTFSTKDGSSVNGIPGLNIRSVTTTVDLREGQWLAVAGLIQDDQKGERKRIPFVGDIPVVGVLFGSQSKSRSETELIVLVSPELVHPLEPDQAPTLLPGMSVTDPTDEAFYFLQHTEGHPSSHHRSTVWPAFRQHVHADKWVQKHLQQKAAAGYCEPQEQYFLLGPHGLSK